DLAFGLAARGVVALRYDKRTFTYPKLFASRHITVEEEVVADAVLAAATLRDRPEGDPTRVYVLGPCLGGVLAPERSGRSGRGRGGGVGCGAGPSRPGAHSRANAVERGDTGGPRSADEAGARPSEVAGGRARVRHLGALLARSGDA